MDSGFVKLCLIPRGGTCWGGGPTELYIATQKGFHPQLLLTFDTIIDLLINLFSFLVDAISLIAKETEIMQWHYNNQTNSFDILWKWKL